MENPGQLSSVINTLHSSDHRRRSLIGAPSNRSITASTNCKLPVAGMGVELVVDMDPRHENHATSLSRTGNAADPHGLLAVYRESRQGVEWNPP